MIKRPSLTKNPEGDIKRRKTNNTLSWELAADIRRMSSDWKLMDGRAQKKDVWRILMGGLCSSTKVNRQKYVSSLYKIPNKFVLIFILVYNVEH